MTKGTFGESLKREREMRGVTLEEISAATRIATRFLQAIETEDWDQLPGGVFNRGFVRAVARYLGLDEENFVAEYALAVGDRPTVPVWTGSPPVVTPEQPWLAWIISAVVILALLAGGWFGARRLLTWRAAKRAAPSAELSASEAPETPSSSDASPVTPVSAADPASASSTSSAAAPVNPDANAAQPATTSDSAPSDPIKLKIETGKRTKVMVVADNDVVFDGTMKAGENHFFSATDHFQITAKDAGAVHLDLNGKALAPIGPSGHSGKITLTRDALKGAAGGAN